MATKLYFRSAAVSGIPTSHRGRPDDLNKLGAATNWVPRDMSTSPGAAANTATVASVTGPTAGIEVATNAEWLSPPLDRDISITGTITQNVWAHESAMTANATVGLIIERVGPTGAVIEQIADSSFLTELGTSSAAKNWTQGSDGADMLKGDRIRVRLYFDDADTVTMASGATLTFTMDGPTGGANGDSFIEFAETFGFLTTDPTGSQVFLTDAAASGGINPGSATEKEAWTSRGDGANTCVTNTATGPTAPIQVTATAGGTAVEWFTRPLQAFTLSDLVKANIRAHSSVGTSGQQMRVEIAVTNNDGTNAVVWAQGGHAETNPALAASETAETVYLAGDDIAVTDGQRLRIRVFIDDGASALLTGRTITLTYDGTSGGATGDSYVTFAQTLAEYIPPAALPTVHMAPRVAA